MLQLEKKIYTILDKDEKSRKKWQNSEDVMTAAVFGTAIYLPFDQLLGPILQAARSLSNGDKFPVNAIGKCQDYYAELWPSLKKIHQHDPSLIDIINNNPSDEPDAFCEFENDLLIIEVKRPDAGFGEPQLKKYLEALSGDKNKNLWLLAVGKGRLNAKNISEFSTIHGYNILYIDWITILDTIKNLSSSSDSMGNVKYLLEDLVSFLSNRQLRPFEGFTWPENLKQLKGNEQHKIVAEKWFPHVTTMWPAFLKKPIVFDELKPLPW